VDAFSHSRGAVVDGLEALADRGALRRKDFDGTTIWWQPVSSSPQSAQNPQEDRRRLSLFENIQNIANVGAWEYDIQNDEGWGTDQIRRIHGIGSDEHVSPQESVAFYHPEDRPTIRTAFERAVEQQDSYDLELRLLDADDTLRWVRVRGQPVFEDGESVAVHGTMQDITERKRRQRELERYQTIVESIDDGIFVIDADRTVAYANQTTLEYADTSRAALVGTPVSELLTTYIDSNRDRQRFEEAMEAVFNEDGRREAAPTVDVTLSLPSGTATIEYRFSPLDAEQGRQVLVVARDISEREEQRRRYETLVNNFPNGAVTLVDEELTYRLAGGEMIDALDLSADEIRGTDVGMIGAGGRDAIEAAYRRALEGEEAAAEVTLEGTVLNFRAVPVYDDDGNVRAATGMSQDVTEKRERKQELERLSRAIEAAPTGIVITDATAPDNPLIYVNDHFTEITGYAEDEVVGQNCRFLQGEDTDADPVSRLRGALDAEEPETVDLCNYRKDGEEFWNRVSVAPVENADGDVVNYVGFQQDVTERKERQAALEARERALRRLQSATRELLVATDEDAIADSIVDCLSDVLDEASVGVLWFDEDEGALATAALSQTEEISDPPTVAPGEGPLWEVYRAGETRLFDPCDVGVLSERQVRDTHECLVAPIDGFGVLFAASTDSYDEETIDVVEVLAANGEAILQRLSQQRQTEAVSRQLDVYEHRVDELEEVMDAIQAVQRRISDTDTREAIESAVCEELVATDRIDFAWVGYPQTTDADLAVEASAGRAQGYLDAVDLHADATMPAQRAAQTRQTVNVPKIATHVQREDWATAALSYNLKSVMSLPVVYDGALYGVLTAYSRERDAFDQIYENLFEEFVSLLGNYIGITAQRYTETGSGYYEFELEVSDARYPLHALAVETGATIRVETVLETTADAVRLLLTVDDGDPEAVLTAAEDKLQVADTARFGTVESRQLSLAIERPFLVSRIGKHGGRLADSVSDGDTTRVRLHLPTDAPYRPLLETLTTHYDSVELLSRTQTATATTADALGPEELLTDRQYQILTAAYHGGYYETPKEITGEDLANDFDISHPVVYDHLQTAHRRLLEEVLAESSPDA
jgi:PAS domain S-box-containing protein